MKIEVPNRIAAFINKNVLKDILLTLGIIEDDFLVSFPNRNGRFIIISYNNRRIYIVISSASARDGRNSFLNQYIATALNSYVNDSTTQNKEIYIYLLDTSSYAKTSYITDTYRMLKTLEISILNESSLGYSSPLKPYNSVREWKLAREDRQTYNSANKSSYVLEDDFSFTIYGKSFGANGKESSFISCVIAKIAKKEDKIVNFYQVKDNSSREIAQKDKKLLEFFGVNIMHDLLPNFEPRQYQKQVLSTCRDQATFQLNLLNKYGVKKCLICGNTIEESIIASHSHRITDIDKSTDIDWVEKCKQAVDPDNGMWLCANHDKLYESGLIYFNNDELAISPQLKVLVSSLELQVDRVLSQIESTILKRQINEMLKLNSDLLVLVGFKINPIYYTDNMHIYLEKHKQRALGIT